MGSKAAALILAVALAAPFVATAQEEDEAYLKVVEGLRRGFGDTCALNGEKSQSGKGYYRCLDAGPYRFVSEYDVTRAYVVLGGGRPFPIAEGKDGRFEFTVSGPWTSDMQGRVDDWYSDEVEGNRVRRQEAEGEEKRRRDAENAVEGYGAQPAPGQGATTAPPAPSSPPGSFASSPQGIAAVPPPAPFVSQPPLDAGATSYVPTAPPPEASYGEAPGEVPPGGRLLAPGVVQEPR